MMNAKQQKLREKRAAFDERRRVLKERQKTLDAQLRKIDKKVDTRKKILIGSLFMERMETEPDLRVDVQQRLESFLTRDIDRELFGFQVMPNEKTAV